MNKFYWLVKREFWENRGGFLWAPIICASVIVLLFILLLIVGEWASAPGSGLDLMWHHVANARASDRNDMSTMLGLSALMPCFAVSIALFFTLIHYCARNLSGDRRDRSILFWKSLPVSDLATVLSKAFSAVVVAPVIAALASAIGAVLVLLIVATTASMHGIGFADVFWTLGHPLQIVARLVGLLPVYMVWMLPSVGWLMLCSAWVRSGRAASWAIGLPIGIGIVAFLLPSLGWHATMSDWYWSHIALRLPFSVLLFPGSWHLTGPDQHMSVFHMRINDSVHVEGLSSLFDQPLSAQYGLLLTPDFLWGALAGAIMLAVATWLRRWRTEL